MARHVRLSAQAALVALLASLVVAVGGSPAHAADRDCGDFGSQRAAQIFFLEHGGPNRDPHGLDSDSDGIACETNDAPYYFKKKLPDATPSRIDSSVRLKSSPGAGIKGERLALKVRVSPRMKRTVVLQRKVSSGWDRIERGTTSKRGRLTYRTSVAKSTTKYRAVVLAKRVGKKRYLADVSPRERVRTQRQSVVLSMSRSARPGKAVKAVVEASPARAGRRVHLQLRTRNGWSKVDQGEQSRRGLVELKDRDLSLGSHKYRAVVLAAGGAGEARSNRQRVRVTEPPPVDPPPAVPTGLATAAGNGQVDLSWEAVPDADFFEYVVYQLGNGVWVEVGRTPAESFLIGGLINDVTYTFAVSAVDASGNESELSPSVTARPEAPDTTPPAVPAGLLATPGNESVTLAWDAVSAPDLARYRVHVRESGSAEWTRVEQVSAGTSLTVRGLTNFTVYEFAVSAVDQVGNESARSDVVSESPPPLEVPVGLTAEARDGSVLLDWASKTDERVIGYRVDFRAGADGPWVPARDGVTLDSTELVSGLQNGVEYSFSVVALAAIGSESGRSEVVTATPSAPSP